MRTRRTILLDADHSAYPCSRMGCDRPVTTVFIMHTAGIYGACDEHFEPAPEDSGQDDAMTSAQTALRRRSY